MTGAGERVGLQQAEPDDKYMATAVEVGAKLAALAEKQKAAAKAARPVFIPRVKPPVPPPRPAAPRPAVPAAAPLPYAPPVHALQRPAPPRNKVGLRLLGRAPRFCIPPLASMSLHLLLSIIRP